MFNEPINSKKSEFVSAKSFRSTQLKSTYLADHRSKNAVQLHVNTSQQAPIQRTKWQWNAQEKKWSVFERSNNRGVMVVPDVVGHHHGEIYDDVRHQLTGEVAANPSTPLLGTVDHKTALLGEQDSSSSVSYAFYAQHISRAKIFAEEALEFLDKVERVKEPFKTQIDSLKEKAHFILRANQTQASVLDDEEARSSMWVRVAEACTNAGELMNDLKFTIENEPHFSSLDLGLSSQFEIPLDDMGIQIRSHQKLPYLVLSDEKHDKHKTHLDYAGKGKAALSTGISIGHTAATLSHHAKVAADLKEASTYVGAVGGALEVIDGGLKVYDGIHRADSALGKASDIAEGTTSMVKGGSTAAYFGSQVAGESAKTLAAGSLGHIIPGAAIASGGLQIISGGVGTVKSQSALNQLGKEGVVQDEVAKSSMTAAMKAKRNESIAKVGKGALTLAAGGVLLASLTNPVGWALLAATGVIAFGMALAKKFSQRTKGKEIAILKKKEYEMAYRAWVNSGKAGDKPQLNKRYDLSRITATSWRTYSDIYKEEMTDQANDVAQTIYRYLGVARYKTDFSEEEAVYIQVVKNLGLRIDLDDNKPTIAAIRKELLSKLT